MGLMKEYRVLTRTSRIKQVRISFVAARGACIKWWIEAFTGSRN